MNYFILRDGQQYGPYTLTDLQKYVASGEIALSDQARSEGMNEPLLVSQIVGTILAPQTSPPPASWETAAIYPDPPNLHWGLVLLFGVLSCGLFNAAWSLVLSAWMKRVAPQSKAIYYYIAAAGSLVLIVFVSFAAARSHVAAPSVGLLNLASGVLTLIARFSLRNSLEQHYSSAEPLGLTLSGVMTFFFGDIYFQYHLNDIVRRKNAARARL